MKHGKWSRIVLYALFPLALATGAFADSLLIYDGQGQDISYTPSYPATNNTSAIDAEAISVWVDNTSSFTYGGNADSEAYGSDTAVAIGIYANNTGPLTVNGTVSAYADGLNEASAMGIVANNTGNILNLATIEAESHSADAYAAGLLVLNSGDVNNTGEIDVYAYGSNTADAYGLQAEGVSSITNSAEIATNADANGKATATGISVSDGDSLNNEGAITVDAYSDNNLAQGFGINASDVAVVQNGVAGSIDVSADGMGAEVYGIAAVNADSASNFGSITAIASGFEAGAAGIATNSTAAIFNNGTIEASASGATATTYGIGANTVGSITNEGDILVRSDGYDSALAFGIAAVNVSGNTVVNSGDIEVEAYSSTDADASGIFVANSTGPVVNTGSITVLASSDLDAYANGISIDIDYFEDPVSNSGDVTNNGTIDVTAAGESATARGINVDDGLNGDITNNGFIDVNATGEYTSARGISADDGLNGDITNNGFITVLADAYASGESYTSANAYAYGLEIDDYLTGDITNNGDINATADAEAYSSDGGAYGYANAFGIEVDDDFAGDITNNGTIWTDAHAYASSEYDSANAYAYAYGIAVAERATGDIVNADDITTYADAEAYSYDSSAYANADAYGIDVVENFTGDIANHGTIRTDAVAAAYSDSYNAYANAYAYGINVARDMEGEITNNGTIEAYAVAEAYSSYGSADAYAYGIDVYENMSGNIINTGNIFSIANATGSTNAYAIARGISTDGIYGDITNTGTIVATALSTEDAEAFGIDAEAYDSATISNSGTINATALSTQVVEANTLKATGIYAFGAGTVVNEETGVINVVSDGFGFGFYVEDGNTYLNNYGTITVDAEDGAGLFVGYGYWEVSNPGFVNTGGNVRTLAVGSYGHLWTYFGAPDTGHGSGFAQATLVDDFRIIFDGDPELDADEDGAYVPQILVGEDGELDLNDQTLIAQASKNIVWNTPYKVIENYRYVNLEDNSNIDGIFGDLVSPNPNIRVSWVDDEETGANSEVIFGYEPKGSSAAGGMRLANLGVIQNSNLIQQRTFSQLLAQHIKNQETLLADSGQTASDAGFLVAKSGEFLENAFFVRPYAKSIDRDENNGFGYDGNLYGIILGYERNLSRELTIGAHAGFGMGSIDYTGTGYDENEEDQTIYSLGLHASYNPDAWHFDGSATFYMAEHEYDGLTGAILEQNEDDDYTSRGLEAEAIGGYVFSSGKWAAMPYAGLGYSWISAPSHTTDADDPAWDTHFDSVNEHILRSILGAQVSGNLAAGDVTIVPTLGVRWQYALTDNDIAVTQSMLGSPSYEVDEDLSRSSIIGDASVVFSKGPGSLELGGMGEYNADYTSYGGWLALKYAF